VRRRCAFASRAQIFASSDSIERIDSISRAGSPLKIAARSKDRDTSRYSSEIARWFEQSGSRLWADQRNDHVSRDNRARKRKYNETAAEKKGDRERGSALESAFEALYLRTKTRTSTITKWNRNSFHRPAFPSRCIRYKIKRKLEAQYSQYRILLTIASFSQLPCAF